MSAEPLFSLDLGLSPDADVGAVGAWDAADVSAAAAALVEAAEASSPSPEIRGAAALLKANCEAAFRKQRTELLSEGDKLTNSEKGHEFPICFQNSLQIGTL